MELTEKCIEEIVSAAQAAGNGKLVITVQPRVEDKQSFDLKCEYEKRIRVSRDGRAVIPTKASGKSLPVGGGERKFRT